VDHRASTATTTNLPAPSASSIVCSKPVSSAEGLGLPSGALDLFGVLASEDRNGRIVEAATISPTDHDRQNATGSSCRQHAFGKTEDTARQLEAKYGATRWTHYILLPAEDREAWTGLAHSQAPPVHVLTWNEVAVALRRSLRRKQEHKRWLAWAHDFCGLIEQKLLGHPVGDGEETAFHQLERRIHQISIMKKGLEDV
jgi:hypothetical protein